MEGIYAVLDAVLPLEALQFSFMKNAFLAILLLTPLLGLLGTMAVQQQMAFFSDAPGPIGSFSELPFAWCPGSMAMILPEPLPVTAGAAVSGSGAGCSFDTKREDM